MRYAEIGTFMQVIPEEKKSLAVQILFSCRTVCFGDLSLEINGFFFFLMLSLEINSVHNPILS